MDNNTVTIVRDIVAYVSLVAGSVLILKSKVKTDNLKDLRERVDILEAERTNAREQHIENQKAISNLEGQLKTYKEIPLKSIAKSLELLDNSNNKILEALNSAAIISDRTQRDGGLLVKTETEHPLDVKLKK